MMIPLLKALRALLFFIAILLAASSMPLFAGMAILILMGLSKVLKKMQHQKEEVR